MSVSDPPPMRLWIGDLHDCDGDGRYARAIASPYPTIQIGDFGLGFGTPPPRQPKDRFIRGNHDSPSLCRLDPHWIPDGTVEDGILFVGGAASRDAATRIEDVDWWRDEELDLKAWDRILTLHADARPRVVVSHDAPESVRRLLFPGHPDELPSRTRQGLQALLDIHAPQTWIFGHWHASRDTVIDGVRFIGLGTSEVRALAL